MNKKILNIITSLVMLLAFFMPWIKAFGIGGSPYQMIQQIFNNLKAVEKNPEMLYTLILLIFPISAIITFSIYLSKSIGKTQLVFLHIFKKLPLILLIISITYGLSKVGDFAKVIAENFSEVIGIGLILSMISAIILFIDQPKVQAFVDKEKGLTQDNKEEANTDDLFN